MNPENTPVTDTYVHWKIGSELIKDSGEKDHIDFCIGSSKPDNLVQITEFHEELTKGKLNKTLFIYKHENQIPNDPIYITLEKDLENALVSITNFLTLKGTNFVENGSIDKSFRFWHISDVPLNDDAINSFYHHVMKSRKTNGDPKYYVEKKFAEPRNYAENLIFSNGEKWYLLVAEVMRYFIREKNASISMDLYEYDETKPLNLCKVAPRNFPGELFGILTSGVL